MNEQINFPKQRYFYFEIEVYFLDYFSFLRNIISRLVGYTVQVQNYVWDNLWGTINLYDQVSLIILFISSD